MSGIEVSLATAYGGWLFSFLVMLWWSWQAFRYRREFYVAQNRIAILRKGLEEIETHDAFSEESGWMVNRAVAALKDAE